MIRWQDSKYSIAFLAPLAGYLGIYLGGWFAPGSIYIGFVLIPFVESILSKRKTDSRPGFPHDLNIEQEQTRSSVRLFDVLLYLNIPLLYGLVAYALYTLQTSSLHPLEVVALIANVGLVIGTSGINVGHELGHRSKKAEQFMAQMLLLPGLYLHFFIEHNRWHHKHVATPNDPATARYNEPIYLFWLRSVRGNYQHAWQLENQRLQQLGKPALHPDNLMLRFQLIQVVYLTTIFVFFQWPGLLFALFAAVIGFLLLESVNYIEHYGLLRQRNENGRYEPVSPRHSWNSDHELGRIFLYELTRHSDHHYRASRKYQILRHMEESPQLPYGYPASILMALLPPLWFRTMNPVVKRFQSYEK